MRTKQRARQLNITAKNKDFNGQAAFFSLFLYVIVKRCEFGEFVRFSTFSDKVTPFTFS